MERNDFRVNPCVNYNAALRNAYKNRHHHVVKLLCADPRVSRSANRFVWWIRYHGFPEKFRREKYDYDKYSYKELRFREAVQELNHIIGYK